MSDALWKIDQQIHVHSTNRETAELQARLERISNNTAAIVSLLRRYQALAQVYAAESRLQATMGVDPGVARVGAMTLPELTEAVDRAYGGWRRGFAVQPAASSSPEGQ